MQGVKVADHWHEENGSIRCELCPHRCLIPEGREGKCGARGVRSGSLISLNYGRVCVSNFDPIEKKPVFHYRPGSLLYSLGTFGCNLFCKNCQNYQLALAREEVPSCPMSPSEVVDEAVQGSAAGIAFTFNEPVVWFEFVMEVAKLAKDVGLFCLLNTNGFIQPRAGEELFRSVQVMNVDVKGFREEFYRSNCGGELAPVLATCHRAKALGVHVELTYLLIPRLNDGREELEEFCAWVRERMGNDTPVTFFKFYPCHLLSHVPMETMERMDEAYDIAKAAGLHYVYFGGVAGDERQNTHCPRCGELVVERKSVKATDKVCFKNFQVSQFCPTFSEVKVHLDRNSCPSCGMKMPIIL